jgi:hypothetical protein
VEDDSDDLEPRTVEGDSDDSSVDTNEELLPGLQDAAARFEFNERFALSKEETIASFDHTEREALAKIEREARQQKATKSDDAEIPAYLWEEHMLQDGPTPWDAAATDIPKFRLGMAMMRRRML